MDRKNVVLNMLVFADKVANGAKQADLLVAAHELGFTKVEVRREYFSDLASEIPSVKKVATDLGLELFYSVPNEVFVDGQINPDLTSYLKEAQAMGITKIKWNIGDFAHFTGNLTELNSLLDYGVEINIENDQTQVSGTIAAIDTFMQAVKSENVNIGYVYDLGNWRYTGQDEMQAANQLKDYVRYIHLKDVKMVAGKPETVGLDEGELDWREVLNILPKNLPVAIEYPTTSDEQISKAKKLVEAE